MRRKISSFITAMFVLFVCVFASACGDKFKNLEFKVYYAFSADATEWVDGTNGISLNYNPEDIYVGGERTSLIFDENGEAILFIKIEINNVKAKHVDTITISTANSLISSKTVKEGEIVSIPIRRDGNGNANFNTTFKLYENNSNKKHEMPFVVSRKLTNIVADKKLKPAVHTSGTLNLLSLNNLTYEPAGQTNQLGVTYSIQSIGCYIDDGGYKYDERIISEEASEYFYLEHLANGILKVKDGAFINTGYVVKVRATSIYHDGSVEGAEAIFDDFYVYIVEGNLTNPIVKFNIDDEEPIKSQINIYENGGIYATSTIFVDSSSLTNKTVYADDGVLTNDGSVAYSPVVFVLNNNGVYEKYDFENSDYQAGINGLCVNEENGGYLVSIANRDVQDNYIKVYYELKGLDFSHSITPNINDDGVGTEIKVVKGVVPTYITVNDALDLDGTKIQQATIYGTTSETYKGLKLKLSASPTNNLAQTIDLEDVSAGLSITNAKGIATSQIVNGSTVFVKFKDNETKMQTLIIKTLKAPTYYNGKNIESDVINDDKNYIVVKYQLEKLVTADKFEFVEDTNTLNKAESKLIDAKNGDKVYVKVYFTGVHLDTTTIKLRSDDANITFENGASEISLSDVKNLSKDNTDADGKKYNIYEIPVKASNSVTNANITIVAGDGTLGVKETIRVSSVFLMTADPDTIDVNAKTSNVKEFSSVEVNNGSFNFAVSKGEFAEFVVVDGEGKTNVFTKMEISTIDEQGDNFSKNAINYNVISSSVFVINGRIGGKTQILNVKVSYYSLDGNKVVLKSQELIVQIAVYEPIGNIAVDEYVNKIGYVNPFFTESCYTQISFNSYTVTYGTPASDVKFKDVAEGIKGASQIAITVNNYRSIAPYYDSFNNENSLVGIKFVSGGKTIDLLESNSTIINLNDENFLNGTILAGVYGDVGELKEISLTISALRFGKASNVLANVVVKIAKIDKAEKIVVSGDNFVNTSEIEKELRMSFKNVGAGQYDEISFNADLQFKTQDVSQDVLRFDNIENALTHLLYKYTLDEDGKFIYTTNANGETVPLRSKIQKDFFDVIYEEDGTISIRAYKDLGGGLFKLVLATKDSFNKNFDPTKTEVFEEDFNTKYSITIRVSDGEIGSEYLIETVEDLMSINNNLDKNFKLISNLGVQNLVNIDPLGLVGTSVNEFTGSLSGEFETFVDGEETKTTSYSINIMIEQIAESSSEETLAGLFAVVGEKAKISNLQFNVMFASVFENKANNGLKIGALAGINKGIVENVNVKVKQSSIDFTKVTAGYTDFGGIVGCNEGEILSSKTISTENLQIISQTSKLHNIGLIAGTNKGKIQGDYVGKESLNNFVFDVYANLLIENYSLNNNAIYNVGGVAGVNNGEISSMLVGGKIYATKIKDAKEEGYIGGIAGTSLEENNSIKLSTVMSLDITADDVQIAIGGIVGYANETIIDTVKFVTAEVQTDGIVTKGQIEGLVVGGIVAKSENGSIKYASVESFVLKEDDGTTDLYTLKGTTVGGLVAVTSGTIVENSFVHANVSASEKLILTTEESETNTYFIGKLNKPFVVGTDVNNATYAILDSSIYKGTEEQTIAWSTIMVEDVTISATTKDWENVYIKNADGTYSKATSFDETVTKYYKLDVDAWTTFATGLVGSNSAWENNENYNVVNINGVDLFFPYLLRSYKDAENKDKIEKLMIVEPKSISASINTNYVAKQNSTYVSKFNFTFNEIKITESVIVNFFNGAPPEDNTHRLINNPKIYNNGLLDASIIPEDAQGGLEFEIMGDGYNYAYLNDSVNKSIVFTKASGSTPIIVRIYSVFNREIELYVAFYTQSLATDIILNSNSVYDSSISGVDYEMNLYTGQSNKMLSIDALNKKSGKNYLDLFDVYEISQQVQIETTVETESGKDSKLDLTVSSYQNIALRIKDDLAEDEKVRTGEFEIVKFKLYLKPDYFNLQTFTERTTIGEVVLKVYLNNSASSIAVDGNDLEVTTNDDINFRVELTTDFVEKSTCGVEKTTFNKTTGEISFDSTDSYGVKNRDSIVITLDIVEGLTEFERLKADINETIFKEEDKIEYLSELFNVTIISSLLTTNDGSKILGYKYDVLLELKNQHTCKCGEQHIYEFNNHVYKYIENNIKFNIFVRASSNEDVNNDNSPIEILLKPTTLSTARIENYVVTSLNSYHNYSSIVKNDNVETSIIEPGKLGNVMMIYLEPTYSQVVSAKIKTSELYVPSLGKNVKMIFTQLVHDKRRIASGEFITLSGSENHVQEGDTLELELISRFDEYGNRIYDGVICVYIQVERFSGLEATITAELEVETTNGKVVTRSRDLLTSYLPGTDIEYDERKSINDGYLIQKGTSNNEMKVKVYGYQFNADPRITFYWDLPTKEDDNGNKVLVGNFTYGLDDKDNEERRIIIDKDTKKEYLIGDYVDYILSKNYNEITYNPNDDSYTLPLTLNVSQDIPAGFKVTASLSLITKDGQLKEHEDTIKFYPTDYVLNSNSIYVDNLVNNRKNIAVNKTSQIELKFKTDNEVRDYSEEIYEIMMTYASNIPEVTQEEKVASMFSYFKNGEVVTFADNHPEFFFNFVNNGSISITGISKFNNLIEFKVWYGYKLNENGVYSLGFGESSRFDKATPLSCTFTLNIFVVNEENEILIESADEIYNSTTGTWSLVEGGHYVLLNDITLENVIPITTKIGSFDGNNRVISIKSFKVDTKTSDYGLFASIGTYTVEDQEKETTKQKQTILKNMIVDYSKFEGTIALNNLESSYITFGGLVAKNNGGLIYNCDVMNLNPATDAQIDVVVGGTSELTFGGLVGSNNGIITNSRVGRDSYTRIIATRTTESSMNVVAGGLTFSVFNRESDNDDVNQFSIIAGGFVGLNNGTISSSYVSKTNIYNYSTNETTNILAGFVGRNAKTISYSYAKADDATITNINPKSTGYVIENKGNGNVAGFVYENSGEISNAYANLELQTKSAYIAGFVYNNTGVIRETYAATTMNSGITDTKAEQPFVGIDNADNLLSTGVLENSYYLMRSGIDTPYTQGELDVAQGLNLENFQNNEYLVGFSFVLSNSKADREQGIWSYYTLDSKKRLLPELVTANIVSHSYRFIVDESAKDKVLTNSMSYELGSANNPHIISSVEDYNNVFTTRNTENSFVGYVRFVNDINFNDDKTAIKTRANYTLGSHNVTSKTSIEGNGMTIGGIYLDVGEAVVEKIGLFAEIQNAYVKNLNLQFATPTTDGQFSTTTAKYSGGLAGTINNSAIININLKGTNTTLTGSNFVGGVAGYISGSSLVYGIETNLNVKASATESYLYYNRQDYLDLNIEKTSYYSYDKYLEHLSYAGGVAGVLDLTKKSNIEYNVQFIDVRGDQMNAKTFDGKQEANILAEYAGGVAGYANDETQSFKVRYFMGEKEIIRGNTAVGGLYGVNMGGIIASQVAAEEDVQFENDTNFGEYIINLKTSQDARLNQAKSGNLKLLEGYNYVGGLVGVALNSNIRASYSKASIANGQTIGGLIGVSVSSVINYSYAIPYINITDNISQVGGLIGSAYGVVSSRPDRNDKIAMFETLLKHKKVSNKNTDLQFTYSTLIVDNDKLKNVASNVILDYVCADYLDENNKAYIQSNANTNLIYVYAGTVNYYKVDEDTFVVGNQTKSTSKSAVMDLDKLYNVEDPAQVVYFQEVFSGWSLMKYWTLNEAKYFPLLNNEAVNNYIDIDDEADFEQIASNPSGKFRVVKDILISPKTANWIVSGTGYSAFSGVLVGEIEGDSRRPKITISALTPTFTNETSGFFQETRNATISNLEFEWTSSPSTAAINISAVDSLTMVSGLTCSDTNSLISNVEVRVSGGDGYFLNKDYLQNNKTISGFGGLVGSSTNSNILGCKFVGKLNAEIKSSTNAYVGGLVGDAITDPNKGSADSSSSAVINNSTFGVSKANANEFNLAFNYPTSQINLTISDENKSAVYIGGIIGSGENVAIASTSIGGMEEYDEEYKEIDININVGSQLSNNVHVGGIAGLAEDGMISNNQAITNINVIGSVNEQAIVNIGGLLGRYDLGKLSSSSTGISSSETKTTIKTKTDAGLLQSSENSHVNISAGVAVMGTGSKLSQCLFLGEINTEGSDIGQLYAGGAVAQVEGTNTKYPTEILETITDVVLNVGSKNDEKNSINGTTKLYAGGLIGRAEYVKVSYSASWGRIIPITSTEARDIYAGGLIGVISTDKTIEKSEFVNIGASVNNSYTTSSIIADSIAGSALQNLNMGGLVGSIRDDGKVDFTNVFYSSDLALFADENYVNGESIGYNLSAQAMLMGKVWHKDLRTEGSGNAIWTSFEVKNQPRLPYVSSLEDSLIEFNVLSRELGTQNYDYEQGTVMNPTPILSGSSHHFSGKFTYHILIVDNNNKSTPTFSGVLNGILLGQDLKYEETFRVGTLNKEEVSTQGGGASPYVGIVPAVAKHSAISNLHVVVESKTINVTDTAGVITGLNQGVVFNSSVQGNGIKLKGSGSAGLIAGQNNGLISYCFSTAEIIESSVPLGGIVHTNKGKLLSNYFTGYIDSNAKSAGIMITASDDYYLFNNYMAGVIVNISANAFSAVAIDSTKASKNFIDVYSDYAYSQAQKTGLTSIATGSLMAGADLDGEWHTTVDSEVFKGIEKGVVDTEKTHFGNNFNYPVYRFNKAEISGDRYIVDDIKNQLYTGTGGVSETTIADTETFEDRYADLVSTTETDTYKHAFKIPHLGILSAVQALLGNSGNYVVIYDINGEYGSGNYIEWNAVGGQDNGFRKLSGEAVVSEGASQGSQKENFFNGLFMTNKYFAHNSEESENVCEIKNLAKEGLFENIGKSYFAKIKFGSLHNLENSGALGKTVIAPSQVQTKNASEPENGANTTENPDVEVAFVEFVSETTVIVSGANSDQGNNYFGGLFGEVKGRVGISNLVTSKGEGYSSIPSIRLSSLNAIAGLIAGKVDGGTIIVKDETYYAWFSGNAYAGGLVGELKGSIVGNGNTINLTQTVLTGESEVAHSSMIGGVVGITSGTALISNLNVMLYRPSADKIEIKTNGFGGIVGTVNDGNTTIETCTIKASYKEVSFNGNRATSKYYGLVAGLHYDGTLDVSGFAIDETQKIETIIVNSSAVNYEESEKTTGFGSLIGAMGSSEEGESSVNPKAQLGFTSFEINLNVIGMPNLGGLVGYNKEGQIVVNITTGSKQFKTKLFGTTNVGGLFGSMYGEITTTTSSDFGNYKSIFTLSNTAEIGASQHIALDEQKIKNFGGLFGRWSGGNSGVDLTNSNKIEFVTTSSPSSNIDDDSCIYNVGGIAGKLVANVSKAVNIENLSNLADIGPKYNYSDTYIDSKSSQSTLIKLSNVGGIFGQIDASNATVSMENAKNANIVKGYQNVGGLVGFVNSQTDVKISNPNSIYKENVNNADDRTGDPELSFDSQGDVTGKISADSYITGAVYGVLNVGGAIGYAGPKTRITRIYARVNVFGNASVGGLVGLANGAIIDNNYLDYYTDGTNESGFVKGIYYNYSYNVAKSEQKSSFIPTSVGGLVGTAVNTALGNNIIDKVVVTSTKESENGLDVINTNVNNMIQIVLGPSNNIVSTQAQPESIYKIDQNSTVNYSEIESGFGGFVGTLDSETIKASTPENKKGIDSNSMRAVEIKAQLGVNVGAYYGVYKFSSVINDGEENLVMIMPKIYDNVSVNGAYNIGGIAGFVAGDVGTTEFKLSNATLDGNGTIQVQNQFSGFYVGGLLGKTNANTVKGLQIASKNKEGDLPVQIKIHTASNYYVGGLIGRADVGVLDNGQTEFEIQGDVGYWEKNTHNTPQEDDDEMTMLGDPVTGYSDEIMEDDSEKIYAGALIGILKVGKRNADSGFTVNVKGLHKFAFTVNTIENVNYHDGDSRFSSNLKDEKSQKERGNVLYAEAYYVNKDHFNIQGSSNTDLYEYANNSTTLNASGKEITNPLNKKAKGWSKEYTGFKQLQRVIPAEENNGEWDSIAVLYDAAQITHVGTIQNLGLWKDGNNDGVNDNTFKAMTRADMDNNRNASDNVCLPKDHISFTVYEQSPGMATLYSAIGIASSYSEPNQYIEADSQGEYKYDSNSHQFVEAEDGYTGTRFSEDNYFYNSKTNSFEKLTFATYNGLSLKEKSLYCSEKGFWWWKKPTMTMFKENPQLYGNLEDMPAGFKQWALGLITEASPYEFYCIDCNNKDDDNEYANDMNALSYFTWGNGNGLWQDHKTLGGSDVNYQNSLNDDGGGTEKAMSYFVEGYLGLTSTAGAKYGSSYGAYFIFDAVYDNASMNTLSGRTPSSSNETIGNLSDSALPTSGSIFEVSGIHTENAERVRLNTEQIDYFGVGVKVASFVIELVLLFTTWGAGNAATAALKVAKEGAEEVVEKGVKKAIKKGLKKFALKAARVSSRVASLGLIFMLGSQAIGYAMADAMKSYSNFTKPSALNYGYLASTYSRRILYEQDADGMIKQKNESDSIAYGKNGEIYYFYSTTRPQDYHSVKYVGIPIEVKDNAMPENITSTSIAIPENDAQIIKTFNDNDFVYHGVVDVTSDGETRPEHIGITNDNTYWLLYDKYILEKGQYYINMKCGEIELSRATLQFKPETFTDAEGNIKDKPVPNYIETGSNVYVHGSYDNTTETYSFFTDVANRKVYQGNVITFDGSNYALHAKINIGKSKVENRDIQMKYVVGNKLPYHILGYDYFDTAYYTVSGMKGEGVKSLKKYAKFNKGNKVDGNNAPNGTCDVDYVVNSVYEKLEEVRYVPSLNGAWIDKDGNGKYEAYYDGYEGMRYNLIEYDWIPYYYTLDKTFTFATETAENPKPSNATDGSVIYLDVAPSDFTNPYYGTAPNGAVETEKTFVYNESATENFVTHNPTYYLYEGGYIVDQEMLTLNEETGKVEGYPTVFIKMEESEYSVTNQGDSSPTYYSLVVQPITNFNKVINKDEDYDLGTRQTITYDMLRDNWETYKTYYSPETEQPLCLMFNVKDGVLYKANGNYTLNSDGLLAQVGMKRRSEGNIYENMYLSNKDYGLYTRYRYIYKNSKVDFSLVKPSDEEEWKDLNIIPNNPNSISVNHGSATTLIENVKVVLGGNRDMVLRIKDGDNGKSGSISIS